MSKKSTIAVLVIAVVAVIALFAVAHKPFTSASSASIVVATDQNFVPEIKNSTVPVFVFFTSSDPKATHSAQELPLVEQAAKDYAGKVKFIMVDVSKTPEIAQANGIPAVPTVLMIKPNTPVLYNVGFLSKEDLYKFIEAGIAMQPQPAAPANPSPSAPQTNAPDGQTNDPSGQN